MSVGSAIPMRRLAVGAAVVLLLALVLTPSALAQQPVPFAVDVQGSRTSDTATEEACARFTFVVRNTGQLPFPPQHDIALAVSQPAAGWRIEGTIPSAVQLAAGATSPSINFGLCAPDSAADGDTASVTVTATVTTDPNTPKASDSETFSATYEGTGLFGLDIPASFLWIALAGIAVILAIVLLTRRRPMAGVAVSCPEPAKEVVPGRGTSFPIRIRNEGRDKDVVSLSTSPVPRGWDTFLPLVDIPLEPREEQTVWLSVKSPDDAQAGDRVVVKVIARSSSGGGEQAAIDTLTTVRGDGEPAMAFEEAVPSERSVYGTESEEEEPEPRPVAVKRRKA